MKKLRHMAAMAVFGTMAGIAPAPPVPLKKEIEEPPTAEQARQAVNNLKQLGLAFHNYADANGRFVDDVRDKDGKAILSWRVLLLPYMEEDNLYKSFNLNEPWDSEGNKKLLAKIPKQYAPVRGKHDEGHTFIQGFHGEMELFGSKAAGKLGFRNVTDGTSNTFLFAEAGESVPWTKPADIVVEPKKELRLGKPFLGNFHVTMMDGSVRRFKAVTPEAVIRASATIAGGEVVDAEKWTTSLKEPIEQIAPPEPPKEVQKK